MYFHTTLALKMAALALPANVSANVMCVMTATACTCNQHGIKHEPYYSFGDIPGVLR